MKRVAALALMAVNLLVPSLADAAWPLWPWFGYGAWLSPPTHYVPQPPYYALYPPVYYSALRTARPYGASPFAWYPWMPQQGLGPAPLPPLPPPPPQWIQNPFVTPRQAASTPAQPQEPDVESIRPAVIQNPYFTARR